MPQQSVPWISGHGVASFQPPSSRLNRAVGSAGDGIGEASTSALYQPRRVLISVLFMPAAKTLSRTSPAAGVGMGTCWISIISKPPLPRVTAAIIVRVMTGA